MSAITFRFVTECQMRIEGESYEEAYLKFKDFMHGHQPMEVGGGLEIYPPEEPTVYFEVEEQSDYNTIDNFSGDFVKDIVNNCPVEIQSQIGHTGVLPN